MTETTVGAETAASILRLSVDALLRKARAGIVPGARIGRQWVFIREDLIALIRTRAQERTCRSTEGVSLRSGGSAYISADKKLDAALARQRNPLLRSSRPDFVEPCGGSTSWESDQLTRGTRLSLAGLPLRPGEAVYVKARG